MTAGPRKNSRCFTFLPALFASLSEGGMNKDTSSPTLYFTFDPFRAIVALLSAASLRS